MDIHSIVKSYLDKHDKLVRRVYSKIARPNRFSYSDFKSWCYLELHKRVARKRAKGEMFDDPEVYFHKILHFIKIDFLCKNGWILSLPKTSNLYGPAAKEIKEQAILTSQLGFRYFNDQDYQTLTSKNEEDEEQGYIKKLSYLVPYPYGIHFYLRMYLNYSFKETVQVIRKYKGKGPSNCVAKDKLKKKVIECYYKAAKKYGIPKDMPVTEGLKRMNISEPKDVILRAFLSEN